MTLYAGESVETRVTIEASDGKPICPLPQNVTVEILTGDEATVLQAAAATTLQVLDKGTATSGSAKTLTDTAQAWENNQWRDACMRITSGTGSGQERRVKSNTATVLTIDDKQVVNGVPVGAFSPAPDNTSLYEIHRGQFVQQWESPTTRAGENLVSIIRATKPNPNGYTASEKVFFRLESKKI